jgi:hypothetical protein
MSDEMREDDETEIEGHAIPAGTNDETEDDDDEFEAHIRSYPNVRMD